MSSRRVPLENKIAGMMAQAIGKKRLRESHLRFGLDVAKIQMIANNENKRDINGPATVSNTYCTTKNIKDTKCEIFLCSFTGTIMRMTVTTPEKAKSIRRATT